MEFSFDVRQFKSSTKAIYTWPEGDWYPKHLTLKSQTSNIAQFALITFIHVTLLGRCVLSTTVILKSWYL